MSRCSADPVASKTDDGAAVVQPSGLLMFVHVPFLHPPVHVVPFSCKIKILACADVIALVSKSRDSVFGYGYGMKKRQFFNTYGFISTN